MVPEMVQDGSDMAQMYPYGVIAHYLQGLLMVLEMVQDGSDRVQIEVKIRNAQFLCVEMGGTRITDPTVQWGP